MLTRDRNLVTQLPKILLNTKMRFIALFALFTLVWACYPVADVSYSNPQDNGVMQWLIEFKTGEEKVQLNLRYTRENKDATKGSSWSNHSNTSFGITPDKLVGLTRDQAMSTTGANVKFELRRDAGTFHFEGWFKQGNGSGHFTFSPSASFVTQLDQLGFGRPTPEQQFSMALTNVGSELINELKAQGYEKFTLEQLVKMGNHGVGLEYVQGLKSAGYNVKTIDYLIKMRDHGVTLRFISGARRTWLQEPDGRRIDSHQRSWRHTGLHHPVHGRWL